MAKQKVNIYLSGPITNIEGGNYSEFALLQEKLESFGYRVINPHELMEGVDTTNFEHVDYMRVCISALALCHKVITLNGWESSKGANQEVNIARIMELEIHSAITFLKNEETKLTAAHAGSN